MNAAVAPDEVGSKRDRKWLRFSLRGLLVMVACAAVWFALVFNRVHRQKVAVEAIEAVSGQVTYDWQIRDPDSDPNVPLAPKGPNWLRERIGPHWFDTVDRVFVTENTEDEKSRFAILGHLLQDLPDLRALSLNGPNRTPEDYALLGQLTQLETLWLNQETPYTAEQIAALPSGLVELSLDGLVTTESLAELPQLEDLRSFKLVCRINGTTVGDREQTQWPKDDAANALAAAQHLESLTLYHTHFTDDGYATLCTMKNLRRLKIGSQQITGDALQHAATLPNLKHFGALHWQLTDEHIEHLKDFGDLQTLELVPYYTLGKLTDASVPVITSFENLETLRASGPISDQSLIHFHKLPSLKELDLSRTKVAKYGTAAKELQKQLPNCKIKLPQTQGEIELHRNFLNSKF